MPYFDKIMKKDYIAAGNGQSPTSNQRRSAHPRKQRKNVEKLSTPIVRVPIDRGIPPNAKEHHELFAGVLRDPSPISPERHGNKSLSRNGAVSARLAASFDRYHPLGSQSTLTSVKSSLMRSYIMQTEEQLAKLTMGCSFKPNLGLT